MQWACAEVVAMHATSVLILALQSGLLINAYKRRGMQCFGSLLQTPCHNEPSTQGRQRQGITATISDQKVI
jgi:hypothetical protein